MGSLKSKSEDLVQYLFKEYVEMYEQSGYSQVRSTIISSLGRSVALYRKLRLIGKVFWIFTKFKEKIILKKDIRTVMFYLDPTKYHIIYSELYTVANVYSTSFYSTYRILQRNTFYIPLFTVLENLYSGILNENNEKIYQSIEELRNIIKKINPEIIILNNDALPDTRAIVLVAKELGIPTVEIQHGIYQSNSLLPTGRYVDYLFVWGRYFKRLYLKQKIRPSRTIKILGYPYELKPLPREHKKQKLTVYYLGQNFELYNRDLLDVKVETVNALNKMCEKYGFEFVYRPHPGDPRELLQRKLPNVRFAPRNETLEESFRKGDIFISFNSTALVEAALRGKLCVQLKNYPVPTDDFEKLGICPRSFDTLEDLESYLGEIARAQDLEQFYKPVSSDYIEIPKPNLGEKFLELIQEII
ncbi:MAG: hypothetical protein PWP49_247 [Thermococcaceae archaeon]|nr:hypothetical protein [Thermococcaceae archaeon]